MSSITTQGVTISFDNGVKPYMHDASTDIQKMQTPKADIQPDLAVIEVRKTKAHTYRPKDANIRTRAKSGYPT
jgi:hypothetical protein